MIEAIKNCIKCNLCSNQKPLLDNISNAKILWLGLSAKKAKSAEEQPLSPTTNSGSVIARIEERLTETPMYKTNLVKCLPLDEKGKLRYPFKDEINACLGNLDLEIGAFSPQIVFLLGSKVTNAVSLYYKISFDAWINYNFSPRLYNGIYFVPVQHPSYIYVYRRKTMEDYIEAVTRTINIITEKSEIGWHYANN